MKSIIKIIGFLISLSSVISYANPEYTSSSNQQQGYTSSSNQQTNQTNSASSVKLNTLGPAYTSSKRTTPNQTLHAEKLHAYYSNSGNSSVNTYSNINHHHKHHNGHLSFGVAAITPAPVYVVNRVDTYYVPPVPPYGNAILWVEGGSHLPVPQDAVIGGGEAQIAYPICRALHKGTYHPGKLIDNRCHISYGGQELSYYRYQILTSRFPLGWVSDSNGHVPLGAVFAGHEHGRPLYICQALWQGTMQPGKLVGNMCNIAWQGREFALTHYNVLAA